jgi:hypothetical protein
MEDNLKKDKNGRLPKKKKKWKTNSIKKMEDDLQKNGRQPQKKVMEDNLKKRGEMEDDLKKIMEDDL